MLEREGGCVTSPIDSLLTERIMPQPASLPFLARRHDLSIQLMSTGKCLPERIVYADEVDRLAGRAEGWTLRHTGVAERRYVTTESSAFLGAGALREALAGTDGTRPDLLISAGGTPQQVIPCTASLIAREVSSSREPTTASPSFAPRSLPKV